MQANYKNVATQSFYIAGYVQDDWRVTPKLSLSLGLSLSLSLCPSLSASLSPASAPTAASMLL